MSERRKVFLTAEWKNLILLNYAVEDHILTPHLPPGCELDRYEGKAHVSLVAFQFLNTEVFGIRWPGYSKFPEINLRFYVRYNNKRGVVFIREYVPSRLVAGVAKYFYNEPYKAARMQDQVQFGKEGGHVLYTLRFNSSKLRIEARLESLAALAAEGTREHFFKEHDLGIGRDRDGKIVTYEVSHPIWRTHAVLNLQHEVDWEGLYGPDFSHFSKRVPDSVIFAEGSKIQVFAPDRLGRSPLPQGHQIEMDEEIKAGD